ncbi:MAG TPA: 7-cyano-7-deazaguanine synthase QueC [Gammaproteobacteria bacterium]|nr:7-cyano-7-deazaguanine synthase QueC [Gammaproteobacteria bacterium]
MCAEKKKGIVLLSGGLDSVTTLAIAQAEGYACCTLSFDYGQRHRAELEAAKTLANNAGVVSHKVVRVNLGDFGGSALTDKAIAVPGHSADGIPVTYVPARNTVFLSLALAWAEVCKIDNIFIGVNAVDYSGYPDCRPEYIAAFEKMANLATKSAVEGKLIRILTPLIDKSKAQIIKKGVSLSVDYAQTVSCYQANSLGEACGYCDSCRLRRQGFIDAGVPDPTRYQ